MGEKPKAQKSVLSSVIDNTKWNISNVKIEFVTSKGIVVTKMQNFEIKTINKEGEDYFYKR